MQSADMEYCLLCLSPFLTLLCPRNKGQLSGLSPEVALTAPSSHLKLVPGVRQFGEKFCQIRDIRQIKPRDPIAAF